MRRRNTDRRAAVRSVVLNTLVRLCIAAALLYCWSCCRPGLLRGVLMVLAASDLAVVPFAFVVLRQRLREIDKGELEDAREY